MKIYICYLIITRNESGYRVYSDYYLYSIYRVYAVNKKSFFENRIKWYLKKVNYLYIVR
jgi:hypothetical protein